MKLSRFNLRTLAIVVALICAFFAAWEATKKYGVNVNPNWNDYESRPPYFINHGIKFEPLPPIERSSAPLLIAVDSESNGMTMYYLWLFVVRIKLPYESDW